MKLVKLRSYICTSVSQQSSAKSPATLNKAQRLYLEVATACSQHSTVAGEGASPSVEEDIGEELLLPERVEVRKDTVRVR
jgi:hypothetical protein